MTACIRHEKDMKRKVTVDNFGYHVWSIWFSPLKTFNHLALSVPDEGYSRNASWYIRFYSNSDGQQFHQKNNNLSLSEHNKITMTWHDVANPSPGLGHAQIWLHRQSYLLKSIKYYSTSTSWSSLFFFNLRIGGCSM